MRTGGAMLLVVVGLVLLWIVVTGRLENLVLAWQTLQGETVADTGEDASATRTPLISAPRAPTPGPTSGDDYTAIVAAMNEALPTISARNTWQQPTTWRTGTSAVRTSPASRSGTWVEA